MKAALLWVLIEIGGHLPPRLLYALADIAATAAWLGSARLRGVTRDHVAHVPPLAEDEVTRDRVARGCVRSAARYWADLARTAYLEPSVAFDEYVAFEGFDHLFAALD